MNKLSAIALFLILFLMGLVAYKDYGISWDEPIQRKFGLAVFDYIFDGSDQMYKSSEKYYGPAFEFVLVAVEKVLRLSGEKEVYQARHLFVFSFNFIGYLYFYKLARVVFKSRLHSIAAVSFLAFSPRIFAHSFYNSKDLVLMSSVIIASYCSLKFLREPSTKNALLAGFSCALAIAVRIAGIFVPAITISLFILSLKKTKLKPLSFYVLFIVVFTYVLWPVLWKNPIKEFISAFNEMKGFHEVSSTVFLGSAIAGNEIPWFYIPVWIFITVPYTQILFFIGGILAVFKSKFKDINALYIFLWFILPLASVIYLKSTLYDGWRQMFFIYPGFILISIYGFDYLLKSKARYIKVFIVTLVFINHIQALLFIYKWHPNQNVYFNLFAGNKSEISKKFSLDYWGLVYKQLYDYLSENDNRESIKVYVDTFPGENNLKMSASPQKFVLSNSLADSDYFLTNFRTGVKLEESKKVYKVVVDGVEIGAIYKTN